MLKEEKFKTFLFEYFHDGSVWLLEIQAPTMDDAQARVSKLPLAKPLGELVAKIPARYGLLARLMCVIKNFFASRQAA